MYSRWNRKRKLKTWAVFGRANALNAWEAHVKGLTYTRLITHRMLYVGM